MKKEWKQFLNCHSLQITSMPFMFFSSYIYQSWMTWQPLLGILQSQMSQTELLLLIQGILSTRREHQRMTKTQDENSCWKCRKGKE